MQASARRTLVRRTGVLVGAGRVFLAKRRIEVSANVVETKAIEGHERARAVEAGDRGAEVDTIRRLARGSELGGMSHGCEPCDVPIGEDLKCRSMGGDGVHSVKTARRAQVAPEPELIVAVEGDVTPMDR
jgi:hypothetical protein